MVRNLILATAIAAITVCAGVDSFCAVPSAGGVGRRPNILYIFTDDQSARTVSCYPEAYPWVRTPNIDKLAKRGIRFAHCYTGTICVPSRGSALTGRLQTGYTKETPYWTEEFRRQGYYTGMVGKWHWNVPRHGTAWDWSVVWEHYLPENRTNYYLNQPVRINGDKLVDLGGYSTDRYTDYTIDFLKERAKEPDKPWYFWVCYGAVHSPYTPAERHKNDYADTPQTEIPSDIYGPRPDKPENMINLNMWTKDKDGRPVYGKRTLDACVKQYNQSVRAIDESVGRIMQTLDDTGQATNTIVFFTSDQGYAWGQHGYMGKIAPYDACIKAPLIVSSPIRFPQGKVCNHPVNGPDIVRTFHALAGIEPAIQMHGRDFSTLLKNPQADSWTTRPMLQVCTGSLYGEEAIAKALANSEKTGNWKKFVVYDKPQTKAWLMLREGRYKYVRYMVPGYIEELYDLTADPDELHNLAVKEEHHELLGRLRSDTCEAFRAGGAEFVDNLPPPKVVSKVPYPTTEIESSPAPARKPNLVLILADDLGWKDLGCQGSEVYRTPNIDRLAAQGMRFTSAYAACAVCSPSRAAIMTGRHPARLHLTDYIPGEPDRPNNPMAVPAWTKYLPTSEETLAEALGRAGYFSASVGKWHLGPKDDSPKNHGFNVNIGGGKWGHPPSYFWPYEKGKDGITLLKDGGTPGEYLTDRLTSEAVRFIRDNRERPFFLYLPHYAVHTPFQAKPEKIAENTARLAGTDTNTTYAAMIENLDDSVGVVMQTLDELGIADNTLVAFTSDNGGLWPDATDNRPLRAGKAYPYEAGLRVPLIARFPGRIRPGSVCTEPVVGADLFPTLLEFAGAKRDPASTEPLHGKSIAALLTETGPVKRDAFYWHYPHYWRRRTVQPYGVVRSSDWKLIEFYEDMRVELYNLAADPGEEKNLAGSNPQKADELRSMLHKWRDDVGAQMPVRKPGH